MCIVTRFKSLVSTDELAYVFQRINENLNLSQEPNLWHSNTFGLIVTKLYIVLCNTLWLTSLKRDISSCSATSLYFMWFDMTAVSAKLHLFHFAWFLQRVSIACYAERCISYSKSVRPSVRHTLALCQNDSSYDHGVFTHDSSFLMVNFTAKFQREHRERGRRMRVG